MPTDTDLIKLYSEKILALAAGLPLTNPLSSPSGQASKRSPLCGSNLSVQIGWDGERINAYHQNVKACALGQAAASVFAEIAIGLTEAEVLKGRDQLFAMLTADGPVPDPPFEALEALIPARAYSNRHASIMLAFEATLAAINDAKSNTN